MKTKILQSLKQKIFQLFRINYHIKALLTKKIKFIMRLSSLMRNKFKIDNAQKTNKKKGINLKDKNKGLKNNKCWHIKSNKNK